LINHGELFGKIDDSGGDGSIQGFDGNVNFALGIDDLECFDDPGKDVETDTELVNPGKGVLELLEKDDHVVKVVVAIVGEKDIDYGTIS
jgi:hypothetical protein